MNVRKLELDYNIFSNNKFNACLINLLIILILILVTILIFTFVYSILYCQLTL